MKTLMVLIASSVGIFSSFADTAKKISGAEIHRRMMGATGGMVEKAGVGKIVIVNAQRKIARSIIDDAVGKLRFQTRFDVEVVDGGFLMYNKPEGASAAVVLAEDANWPLSIVAVENLWGLLNVAKLGDIKTDSRFTKEFIRVTTIAFGASLSRFNGSPLGSVTTASMLDRYLTENYTYDCQQTIVKNLCNLGMRPRVRTSYKKACEEGWAPAPTNEFQRAIWNKVHQIPDKPLTIEYDPKRDR